MIKKLTLVGCLFIALSSCNKDVVDTKPDHSKDSIHFPFFTDYSTTSLAVSSDFSNKGQSRGKISLTEASGLANSINNPDYLWSHEDSGKPNHIYLISKKKGQLVATYRVLGAHNIDWEDIASGPGPVSGTNYLYIGEIGDNNANKTNRLIYRLPEPKYTPSDSGQVIDTENPDTIRIAYPDGPRDAETLMIDPVSRDIYIVSKREAQVKIYRDKFPQGISGTDTLEWLGTFPFSFAVAGDISADGSRVLIKTYDRIFYWKKKGSETIAELLSTIPGLAPYNPLEIQGESICWDGDSYFTTSEKVGNVVPDLYFYQGK